MAEISATTNPLEGVLSADQIDALVTAAEDLGEGRNGVEELLSRMTRAVLERALETEMSDHLGYESGDPAGQGTGNSRNAVAPNQKWVTDVTEFSVNERKLYLSPGHGPVRPSDHLLHGRHIPKPDPHQRFSTAGLTCLNPGEQPLVHSDQGFQYQHRSWRDLLQGAGAVHSMSRKGNCNDNALMENFFGHLKEEFFHHVRFLNTDALAAALHEYIRWYNNDRISTKLGGRSPVQYRAQTVAA